MKYVGPRQPLTFSDWIPSLKTIFTGLIAGIGPQWELFWGYVRQLAAWLAAVVPLLADFAAVAVLRARTQLRHGSSTRFSFSLASFSRVSC